RQGCQYREQLSSSSEKWSRSDTRSTAMASERDHCLGGDRACASVDAVEELLGHGHGRLGAESSVLDEDGHRQVALESGEPRVRARWSIIPVFGRSGLAVHRVDGLVIDIRRLA